MLCEVICVHIYLHIHTCNYVCVHIYTYIIYKYLFESTMCMQHACAVFVKQLAACSYMCLCTRISIIESWTHLYIYMSMHTYIIYTHTRVYTHTYEYHTNISYAQIFCTHTHKYTHTYEC